MTKLLFVTSLAAVAGCNCDPNPTCEDIFVAFESPKDGATGVPATTSVTVKVTDNAGQAVDLASASLVSRATSATEFSVPREGTVSATGASFSGVTLEPGPNLIKVTVTKKASACTGTKSITVEVPQMNDPPKVLTMTFPQDTAMPTGTLNSTELPSAAQLRIDLTTQFAIGGQVQIFNNANNMPISPLVNVSNSAVSVQIDAAALADGPFSLFAKVTRGTQSNTQTGNPDAVKMITLDRMPPTCMVTAPTAMVVGPNDDADSTTMGYQIRTAATASAKATTVELKLTGGATPQTSGALTPTNMAVSRDFTVPGAGLVTYTITAEARDAVGNLCTATRTLTVDFDCPALTIASPDGGVETSFNVPIVANLTGGNGGTVNWKVTDTSGTRDLGILPTANGVSSGIGSFINGAQTISAQATDAVGNTCPAVTKAFSVNATMGCSIVITRPSTRPALITVGQLTGGIYSFQASSSCANGAMVALKRDGVTVATQAVAGGTVTWNVPVTAGTFKFRAEVGTPVVFDELDVVVDLNAPAISQPFDGAVISLASDAAPGTPGIQRPLVYTATVPVGGRADVCSNQVPAATGSTPCADGAAGWWTLKANVTTPDATFTFPDGSYCLKLVVVSGTTTNVSQPVCLVVDSVAPTLTGVTLLRDANSDNKLNLAELNGLPPEFQFTVGGGHTQATINQVRVIEGATVFNTAGAVSYSGASMNIVNVKLDQNVTATTQTYNWIIEVTDNVGNIGTSLVQIVKVDKVAPTCAITSPTNLELGRPDDVNLGTAAFDLKIDVAGSADTTTVTIGTTGGQTLTSMDTAVNGNATHTFALTQTSGVVTYNLTASCRDDSGNSTTATPVTGLAIDLDPPTCAMTAPAASPPQYSTLGLATSVTVGGPGTVGRTVTVYAQVGAGPRAQVGALTVAAGGIAAGTVSYNAGMQTVTAEVTDTAGNLCSVPGRVIDINSAQCAIAFTSPTIGASGKAYLTNTSFTVTGVTSNCGAGKTVELFQVGNTTPLGTGTTMAGGVVSINGTLPEGGPYTLRLRIDNGAALTTDTDLAPVFVDATPPTVGSVEFNTVTYPAAGTAISFVALNNRNFPNGAVVADTSLGGNADFNVKVVGVTGATGGRVRVMYQGTERATVDVTGSPQDATLNGVSLNHNTTGNFQIEVLDEAGNVLRPINVPGVVDVLEPGAPTVTRGLLAVRAATVNLSWMPTYDDGSTSASGAHQGYEIRWSSTTVNNNNSLASPADYLDAAKARPESNEPWSAAAISRNLTLPPNNTYFIVVRAVDEVGNYSPYAAPPSLANLATTDTLTNPSGVNDQYGSVMASRGSLNNDAIDDLVVGAFTTANARVYVYFGGTGFASQATCAGTACQTINSPVAKNPATESFGNSVVVGEVTGTPGPELAIGSANFNGGQGRSFLYFGGANPDAGSYVDDSVWVEFRGSAGSDFGRSVSIIPDVNGDGLGELAVTARNLNGFRGRLYIFKGRTRAAWIAAAGGTFIADTAADWIIEGPTPVTGVSNNFGLQLSISPLGPLTSGPGNDFTVSAANETVNEVYLIASGTLTDAGTMTTGRADAGTANMAFQTLSRPQLGNPVATGFGGVVLGAIDVVGATASDLVTSNRKENSLFVYGDGTPASFGSPVVSIVGGGNFGASIATGDFNGDGKLDLVSSEAESVGNPNNVWVLYNRTSSFDPTVGSFFQSVFRGQSGPTGALGASIVVGDFDGNGTADIAMADRAMNFGRILVWH